MEQPIREGKTATAAMLSAILGDVDESRAPSTESIMYRVYAQARRTADGQTGRRRIAMLPIGAWRVATVALALLVFGLTGILVKQGRQVNGDVLVVHFELAAPDARQVSLVGDFNDWDPSAQPMIDEDGDGVWHVRVSLKRGVHYTYNFLVNGKEWISDPAATDVVADPFGGAKSVLRL